MMFPLNPLSSLLPLIPFLPSIMAATPAPSSLPQVDFSRMGTVGLGGSFAGLDWWSDLSSSTSAESSTFSTDGDTLFLRSGDGSYRVLGNTNTGGVVNTLCWSNSSSTNGTLFIGGRFTSISGVNSANIIAYSLSSSSFQPISPGLSGQVNDLYCDNSRGQVWVGGSFNAPTGSGGNVGLWSVSSSTWSAIDFGGLNGPVDSISSNGGNNVYFGGSFSTTYSSNSTSNTTNITSIQSAPNGTTTTGNSGYLTPATLPPVSSASGNLTINIGPTTAQSQYSNPDVLLCPGRGTWLALEGTVANLDLLGYNYWRATGLRVQNGLVEGRGTKTFCLTSLPDNTELNMTYTDPSTGKNETCTSHCPLYTDPSITAQDFIFTDGTRNMTGFQMQMKEWIGDGAGLSSIELLTDGAYSSATSEGNAGICGGEPRSNVDTTGDWRTETSHTNIPATTGYYLSTSVSTSSSEKPSVTFYPYVSATGFYDLYVVVPGCSSIGDCSGRTSVDISVFPRRNGLSWTSTISEQVQDDTRVLVYSGPVDMSSGSFGATVILALAANPEQVSGGEYTVVASGVELVLRGLVDANGSVVNATGGVNFTFTNTSQITNSSSAISRGVFEYTRTALNVNAASGRLSNSSETSLTRLGYALGRAYNNSRTTFSVNAVASYGNIIYVGGNFSSPNNYSNILTIDSSSNQTASLPSQGLNGVVHAISTVGTSVYFGGEFTSTATGDVALRHIARYDTGSKSWNTVGQGVDGPVLDLTVSSTRLIVSGNFSRVSSSDGSTSQTGGYAVWDTSSSSWSSSGVLFGNVSTAAVNGDITYLAGKVTGRSDNPANGIAMLSTDNGVATISSLSGINLAASAASSLPSSRKRSIGSSFTRSWLSRFTDVFVERALSARAPAPTIPSQITTAPAVLAGTFWRNGSQSVTIFGGNFSTASGSVAFYGSSLYGPSSPVTGVVRALEVIDNRLYIGGTGVSVTGGGSNLVVYDLAQNRWVTGGIPSLNPSTGSVVSINAIQQRLNSNTVVLAGNFATAGALNCAALCLWDNGSNQWRSPGNGLDSGEVRAIDFAGNDYSNLVVAGSFVLSNDQTAYVAVYNFDNASWTALDGLPGPALAVAVDDKNISNIYAAGYSTSDSSAYLQQWNGQIWTAQNSSLLPESMIQQLAFVPLSKEHSGTGSMERNRMLMVSGDLYLESTGNVTSALYDGSNWHPYLVGISSTGELASGSQLFWSASTFDFNIRNYLARGLVVLVAIAIATGLILLLILLFFLITYCTRRRERKTEPTTRFEKEGSPVSSTHQTVFNNVQAALEQSLIGAGAGAGTSAAAAVAAAQRRSDQSSYADAGTGVFASRRDGAASEDEDEDEDEDEEDGRETTMRYDFEGPELQPGEMSMKAGQRVIVLDDTQSDEWFYCRDPISGREGVVPATYVTCPSDIRCGVFM